MHAEIEALAAGTTRPMHVILATGAYAVRCVPDGSDSVTGPLSFDSRAGSLESMLDPTTGAVK